MVLGYLHDAETAFKNLARVGKEELERMRRAKQESKPDDKGKGLDFLRNLKFDD